MRTRKLPKKEGLNKRWLYSLLRMLIMFIERYMSIVCVDSKCEQYENKIVKVNSNAKPVVDDF